MSKWRDVTLAEVSERIDYGYTASAADDPSLPRFLRITDIAQEHLNWSGVPGCPIDEKNLRKYELATDDIVVARTGATVGYAKRIREHPASVFASYLVRFRLGDEADPRFVGAVVESSDYKKWVQQNAGGAAQPNASAKVLGAFPLHLPDLETQRRVGSVFDSISDLIENNRRRVEVLEEMARAIYREWFVKFRYPGHEDVPLVDSALGPIPDEWPAGTVGDVLELKYGKALKADARRGGEVAVISSAGVVGWHDESFVDGPAIVVGRKGNVGSVHWVDGPCWPIDTAYYVATELPLRFVVEQLRRTEFTNTHAAVPGLSREGAYARPFVTPPVALLDIYQTAADQLGIEASALSKQSDSLASLRDLLLPKLVTGRIDVSTLDLDALVEDRVA
jgi:type I restriction enzyme S subunit